MKLCILTGLLLFANTLLFAQVRLKIKLTGAEATKADSVYIKFPSLNKEVGYDSINTLNLTLDTNTNIRLPLYAETTNLRTPVIVINALSKVVNLITLDFSTQGHSQKFCPMCKKRDQLINVVYGFPSQDMAVRVSKKEVWLSTKQLKNNNPKYYCKRDQLEF